MSYVTHANRYARQHGRLCDRLGRARRGDLRGVTSNGDQDGAMNPGPAGIARRPTCELPALRRDHPRCRGPARPSGRSAPADGPSRGAGRLACGAAASLGVGRLPRIPIPASTAPGAVRRSAACSGDPVSPAVGQAGPADVGHCSLPRCKQADGSRVGCLADMSLPAGQPGGSWSFPDRQPEGPATGRLLPPARGHQVLEEGSRCCGSG